MNLIAIETATECCSVALLRGDEIVERSEVAPRRHAELVLPMVESVLAEAGLARTQLDGLAVGRGPGAFTGVRLAISVAQGLAFALDVPVVPVSTLAALAMQAPRNKLPILAVLDARMGEIYAAAFTRSASDALLPLDQERVLAPQNLQLPEATGWNVIGSGWAAYASILQSRLPLAPQWIAADAFPQARDVARLAAPLLNAGQGVSAELALPVYLRDKVAQTVAEREALTQR